MIEISNLSGELGEFRLRDINLQVDEAEYLVILGPTGAGKTVLLEYVVGIHRPRQGTILVEGQDITGLDIEERNIAYVPQDYALFPNMNVEKNIAFGLAARRVKQRTIDETVERILTALGIEHLRFRMPLNLSGGEKQRVALGRAMATGPKLVLLDEPLSALDESLRSSMARELRRIQKTLNGTFIHICHNFEEAADVADRIAVMNQGRLVQTGTLEEIMRNPKNEFVTRFLKTQNIFDAVSDGALLTVGDMVLRKPGTRPGEVVGAIRPENITLVDNNGSRGENVFSGRIVRMQRKPCFVELEVDIGIPLILYSTPDNGCKEGETVSVELAPGHIIVTEKE